MPNRTLTMMIGENQNFLRSSGKPQRSYKELGYSDAEVYIPYDCSTRLQRYVDRIKNTARAPSFSGHVPEDYR